jgi:hypothetical protein
LVKRLSSHKSKFKSFTNGKGRYITSFKIIENNCYDIVLIEEHPCENKDQLHRRERHYIETIQCVNKHIPCRTNKEFYQDNKEVILEHQKEYKLANREHISEYKKQYYQDNREHISNKKKQYYQNKKLNITVE